MKKLKLLKLFCAIIISVTVFSCASRKKDTSEDFGPPPPPNWPSSGVKTETLEESKNPESTPEPVAAEKKEELLEEDWVLVLGPGLAKGLAYIGVLKEIEDLHLKIKAVTGVEIGAMVGTIWASSNANSLEWEFHKFKKDTLFDYPMFGLKKDLAKGEKLYSYLHSAIKVSNLSKTKIPMHVGSLVNGDLQLENSGSASDIIRGAMTLDGLMRPHHYTDQDRSSASIEKAFLVDEAKNLNLGKTLCIDIFTKSKTAFPKEPKEQQFFAMMKSVAKNAQSELAKCDQVVTINTSTAGYFDFDKKADLVYAGKQAIENWVKKK